MTPQEFSHELESTYGYTIPSNLTILGDIKTFRITSNEVILFSKNLKGFYITGLKAGKRESKVVPSNELIKLDFKNFKHNILNLSKEQALTYVSGKEFVNSFGKTGFFIVSYKNIGLGRIVLSNEKCIPQVSKSETIKF